MLGRTIALAFLTVAAVLPASAANTAYDRAASMATGETALGRGYDGANAAGAVKASANGTFSNAGLATPEASRSSVMHPALNTAAVPAPYRGGDFPASGTGFEAAGTAEETAARGVAGALIGASLGFGIALTLSKLLG